VGAPVTLGNFAPTSWKKKKKNLGWWWYTWTDWNLLREPLGASNLKEGALWAVGEKSLPRKKKKLSNLKEGEILQAGTWERNGDTPIGSLWLTALRREQCDM
jgi:hypothetical protein